MERTQFTFYQSFAQALARIKSKSARCDAYDAIINYAIYGTIPDLETLPDSAAIAFELIKPTLDASKRKAENGSKVKANEKQTGSKPEANEEQNEPNPEQTANEKEGENEKEREIEIEKENECYFSPHPPHSLTAEQRDRLIRCALEGHSTELVNSVFDWVRYKIERRETYKETGLRSMLTQIERNAVQYGDDAMTAVILDSMSSGYKGIVFDRLSKRGAARPNQITTAAETPQRSVYPSISESELNDRINRI